MSVKIIEPLDRREHERMNMRGLIRLVLGATGKTGSRVAERLSAWGQRADRRPVRCRRPLRLGQPGQRSMTSCAGRRGLYSSRPPSGPASLTWWRSSSSRPSGPGSGTSPTSAHTAWSSAPAEVALRAVELDLAARQFPHQLGHPPSLVHGGLQRDVPPAGERRDRGARRGGSRGLRQREDIASVAAVTLTEPAGARRARLRPDRPAGAHDGRSRPAHHRRGRPDHHLPGHRPRTMDRRHDQHPVYQPSTPRSCAPSPRPSPAETAPGQTATSSTVTGTAPVTFAEFAAKAAPAWK